MSYVIEEMEEMTNILIGDRQYKLAGFGRRFVAYIIDGFLFVLFSLVLVIFLFGMSVIYKTASIHGLQISTGFLASIITALFTSC